MSKDKATQNEERSPDEIEAEIEVKREELGDTVASVADKADVKKQAKKKAELMKEEATAKANELKDRVASSTGPSGSAGAGVGTSGGDVGSGPTGDVQPGSRSGSGSIADPGNPVVWVAAALVAGIVIGRLTSRS